MNRRSRHARLPLLIGLLLLLALIPFALFRGSQVPEAEAAWWNESWQYRQSIAVTNNTTQQSNVYITVNLDTSNTSKFQADCGDLRFTKQNGQLLPYYIASGCGTASTSVHVQLDTFPAGAQTFYAYYGNPSADNGFSSNDFLTEATSYTVGGTGSEEVGPGPVAHWKFDEGSGSTAHDSASYATGDELLADGNMEATDTSAWASGSGAILSKQTTDPHGGSRLMRVTYNGTSNPYGYQGILAVGKIYKVTGWARSDGAVVPRLVSGSTLDKYLTNSTAWQYFEFEWTADSVIFALRAQTSIPGYAEYDDVSVREVVSGNQGTISGATWADEDQCVSGKCLYFNGSNYVQLTAPNSVKTANKTITFWAKPTTSITTTTPIVSLNAANWYAGFGGPTNRMMTSYSISTGTQQTTLSETVVATVNEWNSYTYTFSISGSDVVVSMYKNGALVTSSSYTSGYSSSYGSTLYIGGFNSSSFLYTGYLDEVKIFPYTLTEDQIKTEYNLGAAAVMGSGPTAPAPAGGTLSDSLVAYWAFDEQYGQTAHDKVGNSHGTLSGATWQSSGKLNSAVGFADDGSYVDSTSDISIGTEDFSVSGWIYLKSSPPSGTLSGGIIGTGVNNGIQMIVTPNGQVRVRNYTGTTYSGWEFWSTEPLPIDQWTHFTYVADRDGSAFFYFNGKTSGQHNISSRSTQEILIRPRMGHNQWLSLPEDNRTLYGYLDEVKIYNTALTADQVKQDMNAGASVAYSVGSEEADELADGAGAPPIAQWKFDEKQGTLAYDSSGNANDGTVNGATWKSGCQQGACLEFDGVDDYTEYGDILDMGTKDMTTSLWLKTTVSGSQQYALSKSRASSIDFRYGIATNMGQAKVFIKGSGGSDAIIQGVANVADDQWHHIVATFDRDGAASIYVDGKFDASASISTWNRQDFQSNVPFRIGSYTASNNVGLFQPFSGQIDHVRIYDYARTPAQIAYDYNRGAPVAHWKFDECEGTVAHDASGNENHGTINIGATGTQTTAGTCSTSGAWANGASGKFEGSLNFDGTDDYVSVADSNSISVTNGPFSYFAWVYIKGSLASNTSVLRKRPSNFVMGYNSRLIHCNLNGTSVNTGTQLLSNSWHFLGCTYDGTTLKGYLDGVLQGSVAATPVVDSNQVLELGGQSTGSQMVNGQIDDVRIYNYALSPSQIQKVHNQGYGVRHAPSD